MRRRRLMPSGSFEGVAGRPLSRVVLIGNIGFGGFLTIAAVWPGWSGHQRLGLGVTAFGWVAMCAGFFVLALHRPQLTATDIVEVQGGGVQLPVTRRLTVAVLGAAVGFVVPSVAGAVVTHGGWRVFWSVLVLLVAMVVVNESAMLRHRRWLVLTSWGVDVGGSRRAGRLAWDDLAGVEWLQGMNGQMSFRLTACQLAPSFESTWRHPAARRRAILDVETLSIDLDPMFALATTPPDVAAQFVAKFRPRGT